jgi:Uncharacterized protein conserved in bacteria (DUF2188)
MQKTRYDVVPKGDSWVVEAEGKSTPPLPTKEMAVEAATRRAREDDAPAQVVVHAEDGTVQEEQTFGDDRNPAAR